MYSNTVICARPRPRLDFTPHTRYFFGIDIASIMRMILILRSNNKGFKIDMIRNNHAYYCESGQSGVRRAAKGSTS